MQHTIKSDIEITGIGLHSGTEVTMILRPASADHGIVFLRRDVTDRDNRVAALWNRVVDTRLCTVIGNDDGVTVGTIEHLMAALRGCGVDNVLIDLDGPEVPVMDGSSAEFVARIKGTGTIAQNRPRGGIKILKEISVTDGDKTVMLKPGSESVFSGHIDFAHPDIGVQSYELQLVNGNFAHQLADARTFGFAEEVAMLRANGLALGGSLENAIVLENDRILNEEGLRYEDEFIRHKLLDAVGDLYLAGGPIIGTYEGSKAGHALNNAILRELFARTDAWIPVDLYEEPSATEPCAYAPEAAYA